MTANEVLDELKTQGSKSYKKMLFDNYGVKEACFNVKIGGRGLGIWNVEFHGLPEDSWSLVSNSLIR